MWLLKGNEHATSDIMTQRWNKYAHLKNNVQCNLFFKHEKGGMPLHEMHKFLLQTPMKSFLYEILNTISSKKPNASTILMQMHNGKLSKNHHIFVFWS